MLLPIAETARRRTDFSSITNYADDFIIGALLLIAARAAATVRPMGNGLLIAAWATLCGGLYYSFFGQLEMRLCPDISGLSNLTIAVIKGVLYVVALYSLVRAVRANAT